MFICFEHSNEFIWIILDFVMHLNNVSTASDQKWKVITPVFDEYTCRQKLRFFLHHTAPLQHIFPRDKSRKWSD